MTHDFKAAYEAVKRYGVYYANVDGIAEEAFRIAAGVNGHSGGNSRLDLEESANIKLIQRIANDYIELSHDKVRLQRDDYIRWCRERLAELYKE
jgi:hypothetical protein